MHGSDNRFKGGKSITATAAATSDFTKLEAFGPDNIIFVTGDSFSIKAEGNVEAIAKLRYKVEDGTIIIGREKGKFWGKDGKGTVITVTAPTLVEASLAGTDADVSIAGSGDVSLIASGKVDASIAGSDNVSVAGGAKCTSSTIGSGSISCS